MKLNTPIPLSQPGSKILLTDKILSIGSCFSESIGNKLVENKFDALINPFGTIFDPLSIIRLLTYSITQTSPPPETYVFSQGVYKNLELHSSFTGMGKDELALKINARISSTYDFIKTANWLIITLGTAHIYQYKKTKSPIANCQKLSANQFNKHLVNKDDLFDSFQPFLKLLKSINPSIKIIITVSPVRHISDGLMANSISKSILRQLSHDLSTSNTYIHYYPAYEIMMDDLRDYRFYKEDMIHPTNQAIDYIWQHFVNSFMVKETTDFLKKWQEISRALLHRPFNPSTTDHQEFLKQTLQKLNLLRNKVDVRREIELINKQIIKD